MQLILDCNRYLQSDILLNGNVSLGTSGLVTVNAGKKYHSEHGWHVVLQVTLLLPAQVLLVKRALSILNGALLTTNSVAGTILTNANTVTSFNATNTGTGVITLTNTAAPLTITLALHKVARVM